MNSITITGNLGRDSELKNVGDSVVCSFAVADSQGREKPTIWWNCALWGKRAETLSQYLLKGQQVTVIGALSEREWKDKDGTPRKSIDVRVVDVALMGGRREESRPAAATIKPAPMDDDDDVPF